MIQSLPCPACHRTLVLAADASLQAVLRCRHCSHQFVLGEMIEAELGFWEVVDDPNAAELSFATRLGTDAADNGTADVEQDSELQLAESSEYVSPQSLIKKRAEKKNVDWSKFEPITHEQYERMRRKGKSPIWSLLSVMLGGLASIPIATLLIWHLLGKDPLQMGPIVGRYVPWIVPTKFQPYDSNLADEVAPPPAGRSGFRRFDAEMDESEVKSDPQGSANLMVEANSISATAEPHAIAPSRPILPGDRRAHSGSPMPQSAPVGDPAFEPNPTVGLPAEEVTPAMGENVFKLINEAEKDLQAWNARTEDFESRKKLAQQTYLRLSAIASAINDIPSTSPLRRLVRNELQTVGEMVASQRDTQELLQAGSRSWLDRYRNEPQVGLALVIEVAEVTEIDNVWKITSTQSSALGKPALEISAPSEIASSILPGQQLLLLGILEFSAASNSSENSTAAPDESKTLSPTGQLENTSAAREVQQLIANYIFRLEPKAD